jgi:hypothetical protein
MIHGPPDLNVIPHNIPIDLNAQPHQLDEGDFLELNYLINPVDHLPGENVVFALGAPNAFVQPPNAHVQPPADVDMDQPDELLSVLTITISSANTLSDESGASVNGIAHPQQLHIGLALVPEIPVDPVASISPCYGSEQASFFYSKEGTIAWSSFFKPDGALVNTVSVPAQWADFFTAKLLTPEDFDWAKSLLQSKIWQIVSEFDLNNPAASRAFALPRNCPSLAPPVCSLSVATLEVTQGFLTPQAPRIQAEEQSFSTSVLHHKKKGKNLPLACSEVRRSARLKLLNKGYRAKTCFDKNCLACAAIAPPVKKSVVRNLCHKFNIQDSPEVDGKDDSGEDEPPVVRTRSGQGKSATDVPNASKPKKSKKK